MWKDHRTRLLSIADKKGYDAIVAFEPENVFYLTGFWGESIAICTNSGTKLIAPLLEGFRAQQTCKDCEVILSNRGSNLISTLISQINGRMACTDCSDFLIIEFIRLKMGEKSFVTNRDLFLQSRIIKDEKEIKAISKGAKILDTLYELCIEEIKVGLSERNLQAKLIFEAMRMGANTASYKYTFNPLIIAGGPNGALPHAEVSDRKFREGDMIVIDLTLRYAHYISDSTRTFALGKTTNEMKKVYDTVKQSHSVGLETVRDGASCHEIDTACRAYIDKEGYSRHFIHSTGHGIGLDVHEPPWLTIKNEETLKTNMAITVEPGIYLEGKFGVRIEDSIIVDGNKGRNGGIRNLNSFTKDLLVLG